MPVIPDTYEAKVREVQIQDLPRPFKIVSEWKVKLLGLYLSGGVPKQK